MSNRSHGTTFRSIQSNQPLLEFFQQKAFVYVEEVFNTNKPYCVTVVNRSRFDILLNRQTVNPNGISK